MDLTAGELRVVVVFFLNVWTRHRVTVGRLVLQKAQTRAVLWTIRS